MKNFAYLLAGSFMARLGIIGIDNLPPWDLFYWVRLILAALLSLVSVVVISVLLEKYKNKWNGVQKFGKNVLQSESEGL